MLRLARRHLAVGGLHRVCEAKLAHAPCGATQLRAVSANRVELFGARIKLIGSSPSAIRWGTDPFGSPTPLAG